MSQIINRGLVGYNLIARGYAEAIVAYIIRLRKGGGGSTDVKRKEQKPFIGVRAVLVAVKNGIKGFGQFFDGTQYIDVPKGEAKIAIEAVVVSEAVEPIQFNIELLSAGHGKK